MSGLRWIQPWWIREGCGVLKWMNFRSLVLGREWMQDLIKIKLCFNASWSVCVSRSMVHGSTRELILYLWSLEQYLLRELNLELILFILALILPALSSLFFSTLLVFILPSSFQLFFFSFTFSILLILSLSLLYSFHVVSLSALARSLTVIVDIGSLERELNLELILFILALILPALSSLFFSTLLVFILPSSFQLFFLLYLLHPSDSFPFSSLLFSCSLFKCTCPKFNCNSWYRISFEGIKSWVNSVHIGSDTSCSFFPLLLYSACIYSSLFFSTLFFSFTFSILLILSLSLLYSFHVVSWSALARSLTVIVDIGSLLRELNLELILFILALILPALSSLFFSTLLVFILPSSFQLFFLLYLLHPFDSFPVLFSTLFM